MKEIKFRAWDGEKIIPYEDMLLYDSHSKTPTSLVMNLRGEPYSYQYMQYTGLKDKNGKEIFEGDVLKIDEETQELISEPKVVTVVYSEKNAGFMTSNNRYLWLVVGRDYNSGEVIGNIYENPELLEPKSEELAS